MQTAEVPVTPYSPTREEQVRPLYTWAWSIGLLIVFVVVGVVLYRRYAAKN